jgi:hypothetical protein
VGSAYDPPRRRRLLPFELPDAERRMNPWVLTDLVGGYAMARVPESIVGFTPRGSRAGSRSPSGVETNSDHRAATDPIDDSYEWMMFLLSLPVEEPWLELVSRGAVVGRAPLVIDASPLRAVEPRWSEADWPFPEVER